ncbi:MAG: oxidoreductase [Bacteroidetes bacterium]|nr:oxidoreductase [Bacteroidota bacterium]
MKKITLNPEFSLSQLTYGVWRWNDQELSADARRELVETCLELGIDSFDHADLYNDYRNEALFGQLLKGNSSLRQDIKIMTKCGIQLLSESRPDTRVKHYDYSQKHMEYSVDRSLQCLQTDYIDLLLLHRPSPMMQVDEVAEVLVRLVASGKVRQIGVSNFSPAQFSLLQSRIHLRLCTNQIELNLLHPQPLTDGQVDFLYERNIPPMIWSPLAGGRIFRADAPLQGLRQMAEVRGMGQDTLALAWLLAHPASFIPVLGTNKPERIRSAAAAANVHLDLQEWFILYRDALGRDVP